MRRLSETVEVEFMPAADSNVNKNIQILYKEEEGKVYFGA